MGLYTSDVEIELSFSYTSSDQKKSNFSALNPAKCSVIVIFTNEFTNVSRFWLVRVGDAARRIVMWYVTGIPGLDRAHIRESGSEMR